MSSSVQGLGTLKIHSVGTIEYSILTDKRVHTKLIIKGAYYVPSLGTRLVLPQQICQQYNSVYEGGANYFKLRWKSHCKPIQLTKANNLPLLYTASGNKLAHDLYAHVVQSSSSDCLAFRGSKIILKYDLDPELDGTLDNLELATTPTTNNFLPSDKKEMFCIQCNDKQCTDCGKINITKNDSHINMKALNNISQDQCEFLHLHERWDHYNLETLQILAKEGIIHKKFAKVDPPVCLACKLGKAHQLTRSRNNTLIPDTITQPGDLVHTDQAESVTPGRPMTISGKNYKIKVIVFTVFVDSISKRVFVKFQTSTNAEQSLRGKHCLKRSAAAFDVKIKHYRADNGVFKSKEFKLDIEKQNQRISYSGVGARWQNGVTERYIRTITERARTMLLHTSTCWPDVISTELWTYAINHAVDKWNSTPQKDLNYLTPNEIFAGVTTCDLKNPNMLDAFHTFGCPVLLVLLRHQLHEKKSLPKFELLGWSKEHARSVALVLNPKTNHISAQYYVIFDNNFETVQTTSKTKNIDQWNTIHKCNLATLTPIKTEFCSYKNFLQPNSLLEISHREGPNSNLLPSESPFLQREKGVIQSTSDAISSLSSSMSFTEIPVANDESSD